MRAINGRAVAVVCAVSVAACAPLPAKDDPWLGPDKALHFTFSTAIGAAAAAVARDRGHDDCDAFGIGFGVSLSAGIGKEFYDDQIRRKGWSWRDLAWDGAGALLGSYVVAPCR
jgi:putative lipoprotein